MFLLKLSFYFETILFTLGGKFNLMTTYIVTHHTTYPILLFYGFSFAPGGQSLFFVVVNLTAHLILLPYLAFILLFPTLKPSWSRQFFVWLHIVQFFVMLFHGLQLLYDNSCHFPMKVACVTYLWGLIMIGTYFGDWCRKKPDSNIKTDQKKIEPILIA